MGNWKLARWQEPQTLTRDVLREMRQRPSRGHVAAHPHPPLDRRRGRAVAARGDRRRPGLPVAEPVERFRRRDRARQPRHRGRQVRPSRASRCTMALRPTSRRRAPTSSCSTTSAASTTAPARTAPATRPTCARSISAVRTWAASRTSAPATTGSSARVTALATTGSASRSRSSVRRRARSTDSRTSSRAAC